MGTFHTKLRVEHVHKRSGFAVMRRALVDSGSELSWIPEKVLETIGVKREKKDVSFVMSNGQTVTRGTGFATLRASEHFTVDEVVFSEQGDETLLGARTLEGLNLLIDPARKRLMAAGPTPAA
jgi:predicted aspartyl protease